MNTYFKNSLIALSCLFFVACGGDDDDDNNVVEIVEQPAVDTVVDVAVANGSFTILVQALQATDLVDVLDDENATFTVFAPTDDAFNALGQETISALLADPDTLSNILLYHVVAGAEIDSAGAVAAVGTQVTMANEDKVTVSSAEESLYINLSKVITADVDADNGIIHVIDRVMLPPADMGMPSMNIVETAIADGRFNTLVTAVTAANLVDTLADPDAELTVFAPTDDAFALLGQDAIDNLLADINALTAVLGKHVINAKVDELTALTLVGGEAETLLGEMIDIDIVDGELTVGGSTVIISNIYTSNGIIHVIDAVIL